MMNCEKLLEGFEPSFEFVPPKAVPESELADKVERLRRAATVAECDVVLLNANGAPNYNATNKYLRFFFDWPREGMVILPVDKRKESAMFTIYTQSVILPPSRGDAVGIDHLYQIGALGREYSGRPCDSDEKLVEATINMIKKMGFERANFGIVGDGSSAKHWKALKEAFPKSQFVDMTQTVRDMQFVHTPAEIDQIRASAQLMEIGFEAAVYCCKPGVTDFELFAAYTFAQLARGGEAADGYQIGVNKWGTHCGKPYGHIVEEGDLINFYISGIPYRGFSAQIARMITVGKITDKQEEILEMTCEAIRRGEKLIKPGAKLSDINHAAFTAFIEKGYLKDDETGTMTYNWAPDDANDYGPVEIKNLYIPDAGLEESGRRLMHVYPAVPGGHNPNLGHEIGGFGGGKYNVCSHNTQPCEVGMTFVLHPMWLEPMVAGSNVGDAYAVTETGYEKLSCHTPLVVRK